MGSAVRRIGRAGVAFCATLMVFAWTSVAAAATWEMLSAAPPGSFEVRNLEQFASEVEQATAGALRITVLPNPAHHDGRQIRQVVAAGQAPAGQFLLSDLRDEDAAFEVDSVPFLATDYHEALRLWDASRAVLRSMLEARGLHTVFVVATPPRGMFAVKQVTKMDDLRGLRLRDDGPLIHRLAILADAVPTPAPGTMTEAFAGGQIDAAISSLAAGAAEQVWRAATEYYDLRVALPKSVVVFNKAAYGSLDPETQRAVLNAAIGAQNRGWQASASANNEAMDELLAQGMSIAAADPKLLAELREIGSRMAEEWERRSGPDGQRIMRAYKQAGQSSVGR